MDLVGAVYYAALDEQLWANLSPEIAGALGRM